VKVVFFSFFSGTIGLSVYLYMAGSSASYLDLDSPATAQVQCLREWPERSHGISWSEPSQWLSWWTRAARSDTDHEEWVKQNQCSVPSVEHVACIDMVVPVKFMKRPLALAMGRASGLDVMGMWARFFLVLTVLIWVGMTTHDLALVSRERKDFILDVTGVNRHCPSIGRVWGCLAGIKVLTNLGHKAFSTGYVQCVLGIIFAVVLAPALLVWNLAVFNFVMLPAIMLAFMRYPIRMSRAWVFLICITCSAYGLILTVQMAVFTGNASLRPLYAVTWVPDMPASSNTTQPMGGSPCTCGCDYPISFNVVMNLVVVGVGTTVKSVFVAFRCLKGLRRSEWASLLLVTFPVPLTAYAVDWRTKDGQIIRHRTEGMPVQGEVAFDPFAMMDEQPDSKNTTIHLRPEPLTYQRQDGVIRSTTGPCDPRKRGPDGLKDNMRYQRKEYIGCCGFPWPTGGIQATYDPAMLDSEDEEEYARGTTNGAAKKAGTDCPDIEQGIAAREYSFSPSRKQPVVMDATRDELAHLEDIAVLWQHKTVEVSAPHASGFPGLRLVPASPEKPRDQSDASPRVADTARKGPGLEAKQDHPVSP
jgi:hypothetical protein